MLEHLTYRYCIFEGDENGVQFQTFRFDWNQWCVCLKHLLFFFFVKCFDINFTAHCLPTQSHTHHLVGRTACTSPRCLVCEMPLFWQKYRNTLLHRCLYAWLMGDMSAITFYLRVWSGSEDAKPWPGCTGFKSRVCHVWDVWGVSEQNTSTCIWPKMSYDTDRVMFICNVGTFYYDEVCEWVEFGMSQCVHPPHVFMPLWLKSQCPGYC